MSGTSIQNYRGETTNVGCLGCAREDGTTERIGTVLTTEYFDVHQDFEVPIPGFMILASRRHFESIDQLTPDELTDFTSVLMRSRQAMRKALGIDTVYLFQNEDTAHHFHMWLFPRYPWMTEQFGVKIESVRPIMQYAKEHLMTPENIARIEKDVATLKEFFSHQ